MQMYEVQYITHTVTLRLQVKGRTESYEKGKVENEEKSK